MICDMKLLTLMRRSEEEKIADRHNTPFHNANGAEEELFRTQRNWFPVAAFVIVIALNILVISIVAKADDLSVMSQTMNILFHALQ